MFGMSMTELIIIAILALVLIGPDELPKAARTIGKTVRDLQRAGEDLRDTFEREVMSEVKKPVEPPPGAVAKAKAPVAVAELPPAQELNSPPALPAPALPPAPAKPPEVAEDKG